MEKIEAVIGSDFPKKVIPLIDSAKHSIKIIIFDWRWYPTSPGHPVQQFNQAIVSAVVRGVKIKVLANSYDIVQQLSKVGVEAKKVHTNHFLHAKLMIIDDNVAILGSHNYTQNAFSINQEVSSILTSDEPFREFIGYFDRLWC